MILRPKGQSLQSYSFVLKSCDPLQPKLEHMTITLEPQWKTSWKYMKVEQVMKSEVVEVSENGRMAQLSSHWLPLYKMIFLNQNIIKIKKIGFKMWNSWEQFKANMNILKWNLVSRWKNCGRSRVPKFVENKKERRKEGKKARKKERHVLQLRLERVTAFEHKTITLKWLLDCFFDYVLVGLTLLT